MTPLTQCHNNPPLLSKKFLYSKAIEEYIFLRYFSLAGSDLVLLLELGVDQESFFENEK